MRTARLALLLAAVLPFSAQALEGISFEHKDWLLVCDNTGTCRAAGYQSEESSTDPVSVLLERRAGANAQVLAQVKLDSYDDLPTTVELYIGTQTLGTIPIHGEGKGNPLNLRQTRALLAALKGTERIVFRAGERTWTLSGEGANAVLLKMDEFQRRVGTASALIRPGKQRGNPLPAQALPVIHAATVPELPERTITPEDASYLRLYQMLREVAGEDCEFTYFEEKEEVREIQVKPLNDSHALVTILCWRGPYNASNLYVLMDSDLHQIIQRVGTIFNHYENGTLSYEHKSRGLGDCWIRGEHVWDGQRFVMSLEETTGMCRDFPGGAWSLPTFVSEVHKKPE